MLFDFGWQCICIVIVCTDAGMHHWRVGVVDGETMKPVDYFHWLSTGLRVPPIALILLVVRPEGHLAEKVGLCCPERFFWENRPTLE